MTSSAENVASYGSFEEVQDGPQPSTVDTRELLYSNSWGQAFVGLFPQICHYILGSFAEMTSLAENVASHGSFEEFIDGSQPGTVDFRQHMFSKSWEQVFVCVFEQIYQ